MDERVYVIMWSHDGNYLVIGTTSKLSPCCVNLDKSYHAIWGKPKVYRVRFIGDALLRLLSMPMFKITL